MRTALAFLLSAALPAQAAAVRCRLEQGVLVAPAELAGVAGDYIIDTGESRSILAETQAQTAGFEGDATTGHARFAGETSAAQPVRIADLDARTYGFATPIAGVIGADVLGAHVVDIRFEPCWIALWRPGREPAFRPAARRAIGWTEGGPTVEAAITDGSSARRVTLRLSTGLDAPLRFSAAVAAIPGAPQGLARLRALSLGDELVEQALSGLETGAASDGAIGAAVLARWRLRFDFPRGVLLLAPR